MNDASASYLARTAINKEQIAKSISKDINHIQHQSVSKKKNKNMLANSSRLGAKLLIPIYLKTKN